MKLESFDPHKSSNVVLFLLISPLKLLPVSVLITGQGNVLFCLKMKKKFNHVWLVGGLVLCLHLMSAVGSISQHGIQYANLGS